ncbi:MAG: nicotinate phosphoribosyltransferase [Candidatus Berkiellales bacterium]
MHQPIITSLLDTDLYKFTMMQCVFHHFPKATASYRFISRKPINLSSIKHDFQEQLGYFCSLTLKEEELSYLASLPYFKADFIDFLHTFRLQTNHIKFSPQGFAFDIEGPWLETILFEVPLLAITSEIYYRQKFPLLDYTVGRERLAEKIQYLLSHAPTLHFTDFGTRRRCSKIWQEEVIRTLNAKLPQQFNGTSNVFFAKEQNLRPIGTMAHEYLQAFQVLAPTLKGSQAFALQTWLKEYPDTLGIALTDSLTMDIFLQEFDKSLALQYKGLRHDSGDPIVWGEKALQHYRSLQIDPHDKTFVFSDGLTFPKMVKIYNHFKNDVRQTFGIGTNLTNDVGYDPLDIVIKMIGTNHKPVVKISDSKGKIVCSDENYLKHVKQTFNIQDS